MYLFTKTFWAYAFERAIKTVAQTAVAVITGEAFGIFNGDAWFNLLVVSGMAGLVSILMSLQSYSAVNNDSDMQALEATIARMQAQQSIVLNSAATIMPSTPVEPKPAHTSTEALG